MADLASELAAEQAARTLTADGTYLVAYPIRQADGKPAVRGLEPVTTTGGGGWTEVTESPDD